ncbi:hypothetical protein BU24DRAFT_496424 [Aaosphaeria arxii CBS 175.79]|uniref:Fermentation associated protein n=1 Tax=Aaosphaeria arxii CBS 175.79 TaxID=1450172 RepID=A0A6A5XBG0_9PLEO|nr:uncharacterized protein BU24DRAFT_496424 [Aaosphaeria arxii CBS 175.79]KAF2010415.1 hypothetical protein BU24DRAFT_496424 [Aaosphaeria arxii CBS 175.79]
MANSIVSEPLNPHTGFNWVFLVEMLICGILTIFFLFYFNRLFATFVSYGIRAYTWHTFHAYIDIQALQFSLLGGRLFFKDIRYHGHNETILIHGGYITWQYWTRRVRDAEIFNEESPPASEAGDAASSTNRSRSDSRPGSRGRTVDSAEAGGKQARKRLPCRISIKVSGLEAFMYNRTPAYDGIIDAMQRKAKADKQDKGHDDLGPANTKEGSYASSIKPHEDHHNKLRKSQPPDPGDIPRPETDTSATPKTKKDDIPAFLKILPIYFDCTKGAVVIGNEHTKSVITAQFEKASGEFDAARSGPLDVYQQVFNLQVTNTVVHMKPNPDFKASQLETAERLKKELDPDFTDDEIDEKQQTVSRKERWHWSDHFPRIPKLSGLFSSSSDSIHTHTKSRKKSIAPPQYVQGQRQWKGLSRYLDESLNDGYGEWDGVEYGLSSMIADCPCINVSFYWDVVGPVPSELENSLHTSPEFAKDINGSIPPEYGVDVQVYGGTINYGPWADRHRGVFQNIFFPGAHVDAVPAASLLPGQLRALSKFKLYLCFEEDTVLRIPVREPSKDLKWKGKAHTLAGQGKQATEKPKAKTKSRRKSFRFRQGEKSTSGANVRPFGWMDIKVSRNSSVNYFMDMVASPDGFHNKLAVDIVSSEISSSVNHGLLWRSGPLGLDCDLSNPLSWNSLRKWMFNITCQDLELFLLRDHLFLLTDLVADWGSGPASDYFNFVPFQYFLNIDFNHFKIYLNTNDSNIVNNPSDLDDNNFVMLHGERLHGDVLIPLDRYKPLQNEIRFDVKGRHLGLELCMPSKNTLKTFVPSKKVASLGGLTLKGSHTIMTETSPMNTDRLFMDIRGDRLTLELYGWLVNQFMKIKDNYFGDDMHFKTLEEFQGLPSTNLANDTSTPNSQPSKLSNDLDVILSVSADNSAVLLPANLYSSECSLRAELPFVTADLRFTNYYMDLAVNFSPISVSLGTSIISAGIPNDTSGRTEIYIDSIGIFGHRLFGLPPTEPTYVCNWDFDVGKISGECTPEFIQKAAGVARSFAFSFDDDENSLHVADPLVIHDATFLRLKTQDIHVWLHIESEAVLVSTGHITLDFNDLAGSTFSQRLSALVPNLTISSVDARSASRHRTPSGEKNIVKTHAFMQTTLSLNMLNRKIGFTEERNKQQAHLQEHDRRTNRAQFMFHESPSSLYPHGDRQQNIRPPAMPYPEIPHPVFLFQPGQVENGSVSSGNYSETISTRGRQGRSGSVGAASKGSFAASIRSTRRRKHVSPAVVSSGSETLLGRSPSRTARVRRPQGLLSDEEIIRRNLPPSSVALSSSLAAPYFPLDQIDPDLSEVPSFPSVKSQVDKTDADAVVFNDVSSRNLDESFKHTSFLVSAEPGIRIHCTPAAVRCVSNLIDIVQPSRPEDLLDDFQVTVMTKILDHQKRREGHGKSIELNVRIPFVHTRFQNDFRATSETTGGTDQYDLILNQLNLSARIKSLQGERAGENTTSLHTTLGSLGLSITERTPSGPKDDVAVQAEIRDVLVWMLRGRETAVNLTFRAFEVATASRKIEYLASLIHRTTILGEELAADFVHVSEQPKARLQYLAWYLTRTQEQTEDEYPDAPFLTKASYALRAARDHLRSHDSWKIISRFRYIYQCLPVNEKALLLQRCSQQSVSCPAGSEEKVISLWDQWRTWDLAHVKNSLAMIKLFGSGNMDGPPSSTIPVSLDIKSQDIKFILDPGPKQTEASLHVLSVNVAFIPPPAPTGLMLMGTESPVTSTVVQVNTRETAIQISWEICELLEILIKMFQKESVTFKKGDMACDLTGEPPPPKPPKITDFHFVYVSDVTKISLDTINLRGLSTGRRFRLSVAGSQSSRKEDPATITVITNLENAVLELFSRSKVLLKSQFEFPSIYFAHCDHGTGSSIPDEIKLLAASRTIKVAVEENILGFLEVADNVMREEVAYVHRQIKALEHSFKKTDDMVLSNARVGPAQLPNITLALFMDFYTVDLALLQSLTWSIQGGSGRISVVPKLSRNVTLRVDYDLAAHTHRMLSTSLQSSNVISCLELPPLNGRLTVTNTQTETRIDASGIIETVRLEASEIQAIVSTINQPEIANVIHAIKDDIAILTNHIEEIFPKTPQTPIIKEPKASQTILFGVEMTLSGLHVIANAPGQLPDSPTASLNVGFSCVQIKATNIGSDGTILVLPEAIAQLYKINVDLTLSDSEGVRRCGNVTVDATLQATAENEAGSLRRAYRVRSSGLEVNMFADTASAVVDVLNHLQDKIKDLDLSKEKKYLKRLRHTKSRALQKPAPGDMVPEKDNDVPDALFNSSYSVELLDIQISWIVGTSIPPYARTEAEDLVLSFRRIDLSTRKGDAARLMIEDMQLQMVPINNDKKIRSLSSALLPEIVFNVAYSSTVDTRKIAFQAAGKSLDLRLDSRFILPANVIERSIALAGKKFRAASANWKMTPTTSGAERKKVFGNKRLASLLVDANFAGAVVHINGSEVLAPKGSKENRSQQTGRYSQFVGDGSKSSMALRAPGVALKVEFKDDGNDPSLNAELRVDGSNNTLYPTVVPLIIDISDSIKQVVREKDEETPEAEVKSEQETIKPAAKLLEDDNIITADPSTILGGTRLNLGLRICKQEFSLSCQPIARVAAIAKLADIYVTINSVKSQDQGHFFAVSAAFEKLEATVQHVYSRESTFGFDVESIVLSLMNSKHLSGTSGISAILKINPMALQVNARQLQDFLLFREIWYPPEIRQSSKPPTAIPNQEPQEYLMQRYQQVTAATAFPWNANIAIADVSVELDLGQAIGKTSLNIHNMWASSKKSTDWEQNLCIGVERVGIESTGRTSGFVELTTVKIRTSIGWPNHTPNAKQTPLVQASLGFGQLRAKAGFDYQTFMIADIANFDFLMYNVRENTKGARDRLVAILDGDRVHVFCTATSAAQGLALWQAIERLVQENQQAYTQSLKDVEKFLRRKTSTTPYSRSPSQAMIASKAKQDDVKTPISLHTDVVLTLRSINIGVYPSTFVDPQIFVLLASDAQARFAVALESGKIHSGLGMTLGQLSVALSTISAPKKSISISDLSVDDILANARSAKGGTILRVPKLVAGMHTWQVPHSDKIDYIFKSALEGKVDVGWNYNRISYIRNMWANHSRSLASRLGKPLPESNIKIRQASASPQPDKSGPSSSPEMNPAKTEGLATGQEKITAEINVPQSRYTYTALEPPLIETPQLRDMGEATPPLEWIGLHRDRLPNVTHQIVIVTLLEVAREVEEAYERILGSS